MFKNQFLIPLYFACSHRSDTTYSKDFCTGYYMREAFTVSCMVSAMNMFSLTCQAHHRRYKMRITWVLMYMRPNKHLIRSDITSVYLLLVPLLWLPGIPWLSQWLEHVSITIRSVCWIKFEPCCCNLVIFSFSCIICIGQAHSCLSQAYSFHTHVGQYVNLLIRSNKHIIDTHVRRFCAWCWQHDDHLHDSKWWLLQVFLLLYS